MTVQNFEDRSLCIQPHQIVKSDWINIDCCKLGSRSRMVPEAVEKKWRRLLQNGNAACWPPIIGHWENENFIICDGRHEYIASLMMGRTYIYVAWLENKQPEECTAMPMTLSGAITHAEEKGIGDSLYAKNHRQLAEWLKELQDLREQLHRSVD